MRIVVALVVLLSGLSCSDPDPAAPAARAFAFLVRGLPADEGRFVAVTSDPAVLRVVDAQLALPPEERFLHVHGPVAEGDGGHNAPWRWHFVPSAWELVEASIELCDGTPAMVEEDPAGWMAKAGAFCPWASYVAGEL